MTDRLYELLPALHRRRDAAQGESLRALMAILESELENLEGDIRGLYSDWFIETCAEWVVPYIGDLPGVRGLVDTQAAPVSQRAFVANTLRHRRRKGTVPILGRVAHDVSGWRTRAVEFFQLLDWNQHLAHVRAKPSLTAPVDPVAFDSVGTANLRNQDLLDRLDGPFDELAHTADVRPLAEGWHDRSSVGLFVWRLTSYPMQQVPARRADPGPGGPRPWAFHFSPLGNPAPLFNQPETLGEGRLEEQHAPAPIRPIRLHQDLEDFQKWVAAPPGTAPEATALYGPGRSFQVWRDGVAMPPLAVVCRALDDWAQPPVGYVAVDARLGRLTFNEAEPPATVHVDFSYGFGGDLGGGPYDRTDDLPDPSDGTWFISVAKGTAVSTLQAARAQWVADGPMHAVIQIEDNGVYGGDLLPFEIPAGGSLEIRAANGMRPNVRMVAGNLRLHAAGSGAAATINGVLLEGGITVEGDLELQLLHCTIVPGRMLSDEGLPENPDRDSLLVSGPAPSQLEVTLTRCITGPLRIPAQSRCLSITDSIVHAPQAAGMVRPAIAASDDPTDPGPPTTLEHATILGPIRVHELTASESLLVDPAVVTRRQKGCVRYSYVADGSRTPRRYRCQPDTALADRAHDLGLPDATALAPGDRRLVLGRIQPRFLSRRYGQPTYGMLSPRCPVEIRMGARDGGEVGAFHFLQQPQREALIRLHVPDYLPFGLRADILEVHHQEVQL